MRLDSRLAREPRSSEDQVGVTGAKLQFTVEQLASQAGRRKVLAEATGAAA